MSLHLRGHHIFERSMGIIFLLSLFFLTCPSSCSTSPETGPIVVVVTGASSGIGKSTALAFAKDPRFKVYATMRDTSKWKAQETSSNLVIAALDVTSDSSVASLRDAVLQADGRVDVVVNNAGYGIAGTLEMVDVDDAKKLFDVNVWGAVRVLQAFLPSMRAARSGHVINLSSTSGLRGIPAFEYYTGSKFALEGIMDSLRYSLHPFNIAITNLNAGPVVTSFTDRFGAAAAGGLGVRDPSDPSGFQRGLSEHMVSLLNKRMTTDEAQSSDSVGELIVSIVLRKLDNATFDISDLPFNMGTNEPSQRVLDSVRVVPSGWSDMHRSFLKLIEPIANRHLSPDTSEELCK